MYERFGILVDNAWRSAASGRTLAVVSPVTEEVVGVIPDGGAADADAVLASAAPGFAAWRETAAWERAKVLRRTSELLRERSKAIARLISTETGKPLAEAAGETLAAADQFEWCGEEARRVYGHTIPGRSPESRASVIYQPVGASLALSAWNFPALLPARKIAAAFAAGCSVIARPASEAAGACFEIGQALIDAGAPPGAITIITGSPSELAGHFIASPVVRKVSLTGSVPVGKKVLAQRAEGMKRASMELGGHAPAIVHRDADPAGSARALAMAKFRNAGQVCISPSRFYVHESLQHAFERAFVECARAIVVGDGFKTGVDMGPMIRRTATDSALALVEDAIGKGARLLHGGRRPTTSTRVTSSSRPCSATSRTARGSCARNRSPLSRRSAAFATRTRRWRARTRCPMDLPPMSSRMTPSAQTERRRVWRPEWWV